MRLSQTQSHLSGLSATVTELEQLQKQRGVLQDWIKKQEIVVGDWASRPCKLRPEAAKQELIAMNDLLNAIGDKRSQLMTEMTGTCKYYSGKSYFFFKRFLNFEICCFLQKNKLHLTVADDDTSDIEQQLDKLENDLMDSIASKTSGQNVIETYRQAIQDMNAWFDGIIKKIDVLDVGSGLSCAQKLAAISDIKNEFDDQGPKKLADLKQKAQKVTEIISNLDAQQVEEQLKSVDRRYNDVSKRIARKAQMLDATNKGVECTRSEIEQVDNWAQMQIAKLQTPQTIGFESSEAENALQKLKALTKDIEAKQAVTDALDKRVANMHNDLEPLEHAQLEGDLRNVATKQKELVNLLKSEIGNIAEATQARRKLETDLEKAKAWLKAKLNDVRKLSSHLPLQSVTVENDIKTCKVTENDIKNFSEGLLNDVLKQGQNILKDCADEDKDRLQGLLDEVTNDYQTLKVEAANKAKSLADLLDGRKTFESDVDRLNNWLNQAEVSTSDELRATSLPILEEQLAKFEKLGEESKDMSKLLSAITDQGKAITPTLSNPDKLKLNETVKSLRDKYNKITTTINDKIRILEEHIKKYKEAKSRLAECVQFLNNIQQEIRDLNRPVGSKIEDVKALMQVYERILKDLNDSKLKMGDMPIDNLPELQAILSQQDDMIKLIENQLAHLRQLLLLREQFIALINEIIAFIMKYSDVITDIEKSPESAEEKINQYDKVIGKIQECEGLLAQAYDKGQKIASEGTSADQNAINEQLQSLKQQLQNLRKQVEAQKQKNELTLAEHKKIASDLQEALDWLHANEGTCKTRPLLDREPDSVEHEITKHKSFAADVFKQLDKIKTIDEQTQHDYHLPSTLIEMISEGRSLISQLPNDLKEREKYLIDAKDQRINYMSLLRKFKDWVHEAETRLENGKHGVDYANLANDLEEHKIFFSNEGAIRDLVTRQIQEAVDKIWPTLKPNEQEQLSQELQENTETMKNIFNSAKSQRLRFEQDLDIWKEYRQMLEKIKNILARIQLKDEPVSNLAGLHFNLQKIAHALNDLQVSDKKKQFFHKIYLTRPHI